MPERDTEKHVNTPVVILIIYPNPSIIEGLGVVAQCNCPHHSFLLSPRGPNGPDLGLVQLAWF